MKYKVIFTTGYDDDLDSLTQGLRGDVLILDEENNYYNPYYITLKRIEGEFFEKDNTYLWDKMVILHTVTKETILKSIKDLHVWHFQKTWLSITNKNLEKYYFPKEDWIVFEVTI